MIAYVFPGQGVQREKMGKELYDNFSKAKQYFEDANDILGRRISDIMFFGSELDLMETRNTQPAVFLYCTILALTQIEIEPDIVSGHSLGEYAALVLSGALTFEDGLKLVANRAEISQRVCENQKTSMGAVVGLPDEYVENRIAEISNQYNEPVFVANYNGPGQIVITGSKKGVRIACKAFKNEGAKKAVPLSIGGSFHSPYMDEARTQLETHITNTKFSNPKCPIVQCADGVPTVNVDVVKFNLINHITSPVLWTKMMKSMDEYGVSKYYEVGPDDTLQKILTRFYPDKSILSILNVETYKTIQKERDSNEY